MKRNLLFILLFALCFSLFSQEKKEGLEGIPYSSSDGPTKILYPVDFFVSKPARDFPQVLDRSVFRSKIVPKDGIESTDKLSPKRQRKLDYLNSAGQSTTNVDPLYQSGTNVLHRTPTRAPITSFETTLTQAPPPDPSMAVGPNHIVTMENGLWAVYDKSGNIASGFPKNLTDPLTDGPSGINAGDPVVMYDREADRWFISQFQLSANSAISRNLFIIGVSTTPDPTGTYNVYSYQLNAGNDYPHYGVWGDSYVTAGNFQGAQKVYTFNRTKMLAGDSSAEIAGFSPAALGQSGFAAPIPVHSEGAGAATGDIKILYYQDDAFSGVTTDHIGLWNIDMNWDDIPSSTISAKNQIPTTAFDAAIAGGFANIAQPGTGQRIDAIVGAVMNMAHWYKFGTHESIVLNWVVETVNGTQISGIRWVELRSTDNGNSWFVHQEGTFTDPTGNESVFMGCISMDRQGNIGLGYTKSGTTTFPSLYYTGRMSSDPLGMMTIAEDLAIAGTSSQVGGLGPERYGDYGQGVRDPSDDLTFWVTSQYGGNRQIRVYSFKFGTEFDNDVGVTSINSPTTGSGLTANETIEVTIQNFGLSAQSNFPVTLSLNGSIIATEMFTGTIAPDSSETFTFSATVDLSTLGNVYDLESCTNLSGDENTDNDCTSSSVTHLPPSDIGVIAITSPATSSALSATTQISVNIENFGSDAATNFPIEYTINGGTPVVETFTASIPGGQTMSYTFTATADLSAAGGHDICVKTNLASDSNTSNDELCKAVTNISCIPVVIGGCTVDGIKRFELGSIDADDGANGCNTTGSIGGYADRTNLSTDLDRSSGNNQYTIRAQHNDSDGGNAAQMSVWIDFNDDGVFSSSEQMITAQPFGAANTLVDFNFTIPTDAALGEHIMRCRSLDTNVASFGDVNDPCATIRFGETHDYTINVTDSVLSTVENSFNKSEFNVVYLDNNQFSVELNAEFDANDDLRINVHNALGQKMLTMPFSYTNGKYQYNLNLRNQNPGIYVVSVSGNKGIRTKKIIVK